MSSVATRDTFVDAMNAPTYFLTTYGCQMNKNDSDRMAAILSSIGFVPTDDESTADIIIVNSCSVRQSAEERIYGSQEKYLNYKKVKPNQIVAVTGCLPGRDKKKEYRGRLPGTDLYFPTAEMVHLPRWIAERRPDLVTSGDLETDYLRIHPKTTGAQAFLTIQTGCNKFCTYCVVPYARGLERNRPVADILSEAREQIAQGVKEITLLGQTVNSFVASDPEMFSITNPFCHSREGGNLVPPDSGLDSRLGSTGSPLRRGNDRYERGNDKVGRGNDNGADFAALLWELNQLPGLERLHWTAAHPISMSDDVIQALALPKQVNYLHLPVQSGDDDMLKRMNRKYTREQYLTLIKKIKAARPGIALGTDIIVGFSGETREQFEKTLSLYREVDFDISYNAQYSERSGTLAVKVYKDDVSDEEKKARWEELHALMEEIVLRKNQAYLNRIVSVVVDQQDKGWAGGNSLEMKRVRFPSQDPSLVGTIVCVKVTEPQAWMLTGLLEP
ncbi:MAG: MiaB/RimO family radical SAM methylthiotransferase [bacterium]|nr:MiaB/RimO family radical SAM methylthiotransferase [bacterium]